MIAAIILAAGESSRMGRPKALLPLDGENFIERITAALKGSGVGKIIVVLGFNAQAIQEKIAHLPVRVVVNRDHAQGQIASLVAGLRALEEEEDRARVDGVLVHLVDHPFIRSALVDKMIGRFYESKKLIVVPRYKGRRGHPVIFSRQLFSELLHAPLNQGAKTVVHAHRQETLELDTEDEGVILDIDTPEDYRRHLRGMNVKA